MKAYRILNGWYVVTWDMHEKGEITAQACMFKARSKYAAIKLMTDHLIKLYSKDKETKWI